MAREVVAAPVAAAEDREIHRRGVVGDDDRASAGLEQPVDGAQHAGGVVHVLNGGDEEDEIVAGGRQLELLDGAVMDGEARAAGGVDGAVAGVNAFEGPSALAEVAQEPEMEPVAASNVEDPGIGGEVVAPLERAPAFEPPAHAVDKSEALG